MLVRDFKKLWTCWCATRKSIQWRQNFRMNYFPLKFVYHVLHTCVACFAYHTQIVISWLHEIENLFVECSSPWIFNLFWVLIHEFVYLLDEVSVSFFDAWFLFHMYVTLEKLRWLYYILAFYSDPNYRNKGKYMWSTWFLGFHVDSHSIILLQ